MNGRLAILQTYRARLTGALLLAMLLPTVAGYLVFQDVSRRAQVADTTYAVRDLGILLGEAAQAVGEFANLAPRSIDFYRTGEHAALQRWSAAVDALQSGVTRLLAESTDADRTLLATLRDDLDTYSERVQELPPLQRERGIQDFGLAGEMRAAAHALEETVDGGPHVLQLLMLRRHEKDYIIRDLDIYLERHAQRAAQLRRELAVCQGCEPAERDARLQHLDDYVDAFARLVALDRAIGLRGGTGLYARIKETESKLFADQRALMSNVSGEQARLVADARSRLLTIIGSVGLLSILVSGLLARRLTSPLVDLSHTIKAFVDSRFTADVAVDVAAGVDGDVNGGRQSAGADEVRQIAQDFSAMQRAMRAHLGDLDAQQRTLERLNAELDRERSTLGLAQRMAGLGYWQYEAATDGFSTSPELLQLLGLPAGQRFDRRAFVDAVIHPDDRDDFNRDLATCERTGQSVERVCRALSPLGGELWVRQYIRVENDGAGSRLVGAVQDITRQRQSEEEIRRLAYFDALTGLPQRGYLFQRLDEMVRTARRRSEHFALLFIDLDKFKEVNDSLGHEAGDQLLIAVADRLRLAARDSDFVARLGGDEFCMLLDDLGSEVDAADVAQRVLDELAQPLEVFGRTLLPLASMGIAMFPEDGEDAETVMIAADNAMYAAKRRGDHSYVLHEHGISAQANARLRMSRELRKAMREGEFEIHYQPQVRLSDGTIHGWEALLRWRHPEEGLIAAGVFIDDLERIGLVCDLGRWVIDTVCRQLAQWRDEGSGVMHVALNIAPRHMAEGTVATHLGEAMARHGVAPPQLAVEITEAGIQSGDAIRDATVAIRDLGVEIAIDDFGTGYSSLASLRSLTVDSLKIDRTFVQFAASNATDRRLLRSIIELGAALGYRVLAEGVETQEQLDLLRALGCDLVQGYFFSKAVPADAVPSLLTAYVRDISVVQGEVAAEIAAQDRAAQGVSNA